MGEFIKDIETMRLFDKYAYIKFKRSVFDMHQGVSLEERIEDYEIILVRLLMREYKSFNWIEEKDHIIDYNTGEVTVIMIIRIDKEDYDRLFKEFMGRDEGE